MHSESKERLFELIAENLTPEKPIRSTEYLRGRTEVFGNIERELRYFSAVPFIYGYRGVGKTSLARTAAQIVTASDREHVYVACAPGSRMLHIFREIGERLLQLIFATKSQVETKVEVEVSSNPSIRASFEKKIAKLEPFDDVNAAVRVLKDLDNLLPNAKSTVVVLDELEELDHADRTDLAYLIKQLGDQEFRLRFILVGIAENVHELIGAHESVPRYIKEIYLQPLAAQDLIDIVRTAASKVGIEVPKKIYSRIAIIGNGFPHFAHLMGKAVLTEAVLSDANTVTDRVYAEGVRRAVADSIQELKMSYEAATQRGEDYFKHLIWALAHSDVVDVRLDDWIEKYDELVARYQWSRATDKKLKTAIGNFKKESCGKIIVSTPARYGSTETRYRFRRFTNTLMRGHVRLQAENEGITLGATVGI